MDVSCHAECPADINSNAPNALATWLLRCLKGTASTARPVPPHEVQLLKLDMMTQAQIAADRGSKIMQSDLLAASQTKKSRSIRVCSLLFRV